MENKEVEEVLDLIDTYLFGTCSYHDFQLEKIKKYIIFLEKENSKLKSKGRMCFNEES